MRVELLSTPDCPHADRAEAILRQVLANNGHTPSISRIYVGDIDDAAGLGFHGSPTIRIDGRDIAPPSRELPIGLACRFYPQPSGGLDGVVPAQVIRDYLEQKDEEEARARAARTRPSEIPARLSHAFFLWASRRPLLGRIATALPFTRAMVRRFVAGFTLDEALRELDVLAKAGMRWTVDVLGESVDSKEMAIASADRYVATLDALAARGMEANVSLKLTQMGLDIDPAFCRQNVARVVAKAKEVGAFVRVDMEDHTKTEITLDMVRALRRDYDGVGVVVQSYLRRSADDIDRLIREGTRVRLCKGAYDEPASVAFATKAEVDRNYAELTDRLLAGGIYAGIATHDEALIDHTIGFARANGIASDKFEFQMLYGVRRDLHQRLVDAGWTVRVYVPYGTQWYPYYMRRLAERPANVLFILRSVLREGRG